MWCENHLNAYVCKQFIFKSKTANTSQNPDRDHFFRMTKCIENDTFPFERKLDQHSNLIKIRILRLSLFSLQVRSDITRLRSVFK